MESKLLYSATNHLKSKLLWKEINNEEWIYFGTDAHIDSDLIQKSINEYFNGEAIFFVYERTNSGHLEEEQYQKMFHAILGNKNFFLWNKKLTKAIEFSYIGILRFGELDN
ncbi:hypothetical protein [Kordia sp.]|uniref:hypothetical protein n=1 Tax=Kordia sp. TaxID=1965332 RepID=UPI003D6A0F1C